MQFRRPLRRAIHGVLLLDKPLGMTSHEAMFVSRAIFNADKAGHTGTLDPLATGLLPLCFGKATALCGQLLDARKGYVATVQFGARTATGDAEGEVLARSDHRVLTPTMLEASLAAFRGHIQQIPPMYSAIKKDGIPLHALAREGLVIAREFRQVTIEHFDLLSYADGVAQVSVRCSKGTYIRTLAEDWARSIGQEAHLIGLRRTEVGPFLASKGQGGIPLGQLQNRRLPDLDAMLLPARSILNGWRFIKAEPEHIPFLDAGRRILFPAEAQGEVAIESEAGRLLGLGVVLEGGWLQPRRWFGPEGI